LRFSTSIDLKQKGEAIEWTRGRRRRSKTTILNTVLSKQQTTRSWSARSVLFYRLSSIVYTTIAFAIHCIGRGKRNVQLEQGGVFGLLLGGFPRRLSTTAARAQQAGSRTTFFCIKGEQVKQPPQYDRQRGHVRPKVLEAKPGGGVLRNVRQRPRKSVRLSTAQVAQGRSSCRRSTQQQHHDLAIYPISRQSRCHQYGCGCLLRLQQPR
jgi:hypothetical protein